MNEQERDGLLLLSSLRFGPEMLLLFGQDERRHIDRHQAEGLVEVVRVRLFRRVRLTEKGARLVTRHFG